jgi:hypothetical protein
VHRGGVPLIPFATPQGAVNRFAESSGIGEQGAETGCSSPVEEAMTLSTSEVAVCCSSASESSRVRVCSASNKRTFSIAITA